MQTEAGQETLSPVQFAQKYGWKNEPLCALARQEMSRRGVVPRRITGSAKRL